LQKLEQYIGELEKQQPITLEKFKADFIGMCMWRNCTNICQRM
jgi:hypothetical protein